MKNRTKSLSALILIGILGSLLANCTGLPQSNNRETITIAVVEEEPGAKGSPNEQSIYAGVLLAAKQIEEHAGLRINVEPYDDNNNPNLATQIAEQVARSNAVAVVGHSSIETSDIGAKVYDRHGIPIISAVPTTESMTRGHSHQFNITYTTESEAAYLANYVIKVLDKDKVETDNSRNVATIIYTNDAYGIALQKQFGNTFRGLGGTVRPPEMIDPRQPIELRLEQIVSRIIAADPETENPGTIFIATDDKTAAELVIQMKRKGVSYPVIGASNLSSPAFIRRISEESEEDTLPGYFTDGILTTRSIIFDSANRYANQFLQEYQSAYRYPDPSDIVANGYDAALTLLSAILNTPAGERITRDSIHAALLKMDREENGAQGIISPIYFDPSRNIPRAARFGIYQNGEIVSANTQFEPIFAPSEIQDLDEQVAKGRIMTVNGGYVYVANVVYAGVDLLGIDEIDIKTSTYKVDFYLWFRYRPHEQDAEFKPEEFVFTNIESMDGDPALVREAANSDGTVLKTYRVSGVFKNQFRFYDYPFDRQKLVVEFRNQNAATSFIQYVVDRIGMRYTTGEDLLNNFRLNGAFDSIFGWREKSARVDQDNFPTFSTFGNPQNFDRKVSTNYSLINIEVEIQRNSLQYVIKSLLPLFITLVLAYITFFLPLGHSERLAVGSTALLTTAFFHLSLAGTLPEIGYTVAMEYFFYASYLMSALIVLLETLSIRLDSKSQEAKSKADKQAIQEQRERLNMIGRFAYPAILLVAVAFETLIYTGTLPLGPKEDAKSTHLVSLIIGNFQLTEKAETAVDVPVGVDNAVRLTLTTWRPEDTNQMRVLLSGFEEYAKTRGRNISVEYRPVMSVNYDSILDIQLSRGGDAPDLFYVRPFSVDGSIGKYLAALDSLSIEQQYDPTKSVAWKSNTGVYYAVPFVGVVQGVYYNKGLFAEYGISVPKTWQEFLDALKTIREKNPDITPIANALNQEEDSEMFMSIAANFLGGPEGRELFMRANGTANCFNSSRVVSAFQAIEDIKGYLPRDAARINSQNTKELFFQQDAVMMFGGSWDLQKVTEEAGFEWDVFAVPAPGFRPTYVIFQPDIAVGMNNATKHPEEARLFLEWLMSPEAVELAARNLPGFYPLSNHKTNAVSLTNPNDEKFLRLIMDYETDIRWMYTEINNRDPGASDIVRRSLYEMAISRITPREAAQRLQNGLGEWYEPAQNCIQK
ncbi:MAG: extracellular solute-binding protein [Chloroflexi bacterium]|nr:extracellular solute-binding protein [Chloroflexota bacterium]